MRKILTVTAIVLVALMVACNGDDEAPLNLDLDAGDTGETAVDAEDEVVEEATAVPTITSTPALPATYTPPARGIGDHLFLLPVAGADGVGHVVQPGETLAMISRHYMLSPAQLAQANQLDATAELSPGLVLVIPTPAP